MSTRPGHLRPRSLLEILDGAVRHYRTHFVRHLIPFLALAAIDVVGALVGTWTQGFLFSADEPSDASAAMWGLTMMTFGLLRGIAFLLGFGASVFLAGADLGGRRLSPREGWMQSSARFWGLLGVAILYMAIVTTGLFFLVLPGIIVGVRLVLCGHSLLLEGTNAADALKRSWHLMEDNLWRGVAIYVFLVVLATGLGFLSGSVQFGSLFFLDEEGEIANAAGFYLLTAIGGLATAGITLLLMPLYPLVYTHLYWDVRVRKEGLDLDTRLRRLEAEPT